jgi:hypothetical protein
MGRWDRPGLNVVKVSVADVRVEHEVRVMDFTKWLEKAGSSPREMRLSLVSCFSDPFI